MKPKQLIHFDWAMKTLLRNKVTFPILEGFLSELLQTDVKIDSLLESESNKKHPDDKSNRVDILAKLTGGERVIIELQCAHQWDFLSRMLYGVSTVVVEHLKKGAEYGTIPRVISVNIVYFDLGHGEDYIYRGTTQFKGIHRRDTLKMTPIERAHYPSHIDHLENVFPEYYVLKVSSFDFKIKDTLDEWIYTLSKSEVRPEFKAKGIQAAGKQLNVLQLSKKELAQYEDHLGSLRDTKSYFRTYYSEGKRDGLDEGIAQGIAQGITEGKAEVALKLHALGLSIDQICNATSLSSKQVEKLIKN
jgi:predicted transposase/invertase (TIGR01784 family)